MHLSKRKRLLQLLYIATTSTRSRSQYITINLSALASDGRLGAGSAGMKVGPWPLSFVILRALISTLRSESFSQISGGRCSEPESAGGTEEETLC
jgi:hypothetical protein